MRRRRWVSFRQVVERRPSKLEQVLALQIAFRVFPGGGGHVLGAMLRQGRLLTGGEEPSMDGFVTRTDPKAMLNRSMLSF
jgi:hypothetical protein